MKRVVLECLGRLANQIICWKNARNVFKKIGLTDTIVINYDIPKGCVTFPGAVVEIVNTEGLRRVTRNELSITNCDCLWIWDDVFMANPTAESAIREIELSKEFSDSISGVVGGGTVIGIHARFGDYVKKEDANGYPFIRGSNEYFLRGIEVAKRLHPGCRFYLASNGEPSEVDFIKNCIPDVILGKPDNPLFDLFALSRCRAVIGSSSTFTFVACEYGGIKFTVPEATEAEMTEALK